MKYQMYGCTVTKYRRDYNFLSLASHNLLRLIVNLRDKTANTDFLDKVIGVLITRY